MIIDLVFIAVILLFISLYGQQAKCGIPIFTWCLVYFIILLLKSLGNGVKIYFIRFNPRWLTYYSLLSFILFDGIMLGWLIYGNIIFYSNEDDCAIFASSKGLYYLMFFLLIIGYI